MQNPASNEKTLKRRALEFVVLLGAVSLLADITYEGARGTIGTYLQLLGASAAVVGFTAGLGELAGYGLRLFTGILADKTRSYWGLTILGYCVNLLAVPTLALAGSWEFAVALVIIERIGKAIRTPARDVILSSATHQLGRGFGFGLHEFMDQLGAVSGPLIITLVLAYKSGLPGQRLALGLLLIPALLCIAVLIAGRIIYPRPHEFEKKGVHLTAKNWPSAFWTYMAAVGLVAAGFADFALVAFHFKNHSILSEANIPLAYAFAMAVDAAAALFFGRLFDRIGILAMLAATTVSLAFAPLVFLGGPVMAFAGMACWGVGMGAQESIMRAAIADMAPAHRRGSAYGLFNAVYGICWFAGSALIGWLYGFSIQAVVVFSVAAQLLAILFFAFAARKLSRG